MEKPQSTSSRDQLCAVTSTLGSFTIIHKYFDSTNMDFACKPGRHEKARTALRRPKSLVCLRRVICRNNKIKKNHEKPRLLLRGDRQLKAARMQDAAMLVVRWLSRNCIPSTSCSTAQLPARQLATNMHTQAHHENTMDSALCSRRPISSEPAR